MLYLHEQYTSQDFKDHIASLDEDQLKTLLGQYLKKYRDKNRREFLTLSLIAGANFYLLDRTTNESIEWFCYSMFGSVALCLCFSLSNQINTQKKYSMQNSHQFLAALKSQYRFQKWYYRHNLLISIVPLFAPIAWFMAFSFLKTHDFFCLGLLFPLAVLAYYLFDHNLFYFHCLNAEFKFLGELEKGSP